jgi:1-deoxyxylulose-5-phosphate synthase
VKSIRLGNTGFDTTEFIYGAGSIKGIGMSVHTRDKGISVEEALQRLGEAHALGIRVVDTADCYGAGASELTVGRWVREHPADDVVIQTKVGGNSDDRPGVDLSRNHVERQLAQSIARLGRVDLYMSHAPDPTTPLQEVLETFAEAQSSGRIGAFGMCNVDARLLEDILTTADSAGLPRPGWLQNYFSLLGRLDERDVLPLATAEGIAYTAFSPLAGGILSGRYLDGAPVPPDSRIGAAGDVYYKGLYSSENLAKVARLRDIARERDISVAGLALTWLRAHPLITASIVSPSKASQWEAVNEALNHSLDNESFDLIAEIFS